MGAIGDILALLRHRLQQRCAADGISTSSAIAAWIDEGSLEMVMLECRRPAGTVNPIFEFPVTLPAVSGCGRGPS